MKLWQKKELSLLKEVEKFTVGDDYIVDMNLVKQDIMGSIAHSRMLLKIGLLSDAEQKALENGLRKIYGDFTNNQFQIDYQDEDVHTKVEKILTEVCGEAGKKLHTARSRNDQVLTDLRLYNREKLLEVQQELGLTIEKIIEFASKYEFLPMSGYTHMQRAMPSSVGQWAGAFAEEFLDLYYVWQGVYQLNDASPLGSGAGYGVSLDIDREFSAREMGFSRVQSNPIYCQNSRGKIEAQIAGFLVSVGLVMNKIATDLVLFTTAEFAFFEAGDCITTGSSIMPQKRNLDVMELIRGRTALLIGYENTLKTLTTNLISGYHRDLQETKKIMVASFNLVLDFLRVARVTFDNIKPNEKNLVSALDKTVFATDYAYQKVKEGVSFRDAYREVGSNLDKLPDFDPYLNIKQKKHTGATGNLGLNLLKQRLLTQLQQTETLAEQLKSVERNLLGG